MKEHQMYQHDPNSAESILNKNMNVISHAWFDNQRAAVIEAMHEYAAQQLSEYKEVIQGLLPIAERMQQMCAYRGKSDSTYRDSGIEYKVIIDRAKALLQESNQGQPPPESEQP